MTQILELLAPARNVEVARTAIAAGADAIYIGAPAFGARAAASNTIEEIASLTADAHRFGVKIYVTMNTIVYDSELEDARRQVWQLYSAGVDAIIVQDMAYLKMALPPIALHASTQCDIRSVEKARRLAEAGFSQLVLPREFSLEEIKEVKAAVDVPLEVFVHGALCVSYSGDCQAGQVAMGRSANRGVCPQMCRLPYRLTDGEGNDVGAEKHYLSLRDLNQLESLADLAEAGVNSFKIEGRLKDARYVANVVAAYSRRLDQIVASNPDKYSRSSWGKSDAGFTPDLHRTFNRGYSSYFLKGKSRGLVSLDSPKWMGQKIGIVSSEFRASTRSFKAKLSAELANGDGLGYFDSKGKFCGFRLNKVEGDVLYSASDLDGLRPGMELYRNLDKNFADLLDRPNAGCRRTIAVNFALAKVDDKYIRICVEDDYGHKSEVLVESEYAEARSPQFEQREKILRKTGDTIFTVAAVDDQLGAQFVAASILTQGRREALAMLEHDMAATYRFDRRRPNKLSSDAFEGMTLSYHDNVANRLAEEFYREHGAEIGEHAIEVQSKAGELCVMTTRYCLRRELGACLKEKNANKLPSKLFLRNDSGNYRLDFDCARCNMKVIRCK